MFSSDYKEARTRLSAAALTIIALSAFTHGKIEFEFFGTKIPIPESAFSLVMALILAVLFTITLMQGLIEVLDVGAFKVTTESDKKMAELVDREIDLVIDAALAELVDILDFVVRGRHPDGFPMPFRARPEDEMPFDVTTIPAELKLISSRLARFQHLNPAIDWRGYRQEQKKWLVSTVGRRFNCFSQEQIGWIASAVLRRIDGAYAANYSQIGNAIQVSQRRAKIVKWLLICWSFVQDLTFPLVISALAMLVLRGWISIRV
jgi:hypothetical protein